MWLALWHNTSSMNTTLAGSWLWQPECQNLHSVCLSTSLLPKNNSWFNPLCSAALYLVSVNYFAVYCTCFQKIKYTIVVTSKILFGIRWRGEKRGLRLWAKVPPAWFQHTTQLCVIHHRPTQPGYITMEMHRLRNYGWLSVKGAWSGCVCM